MLYELRRITYKHNPHMLQKFRHQKATFSSFIFAGHFWTTWIRQEAGHFSPCYMLQQQKFTGRAHLINAPAWAFLYVDIFTKSSVCHGWSFGVCQNVGEIKFYSSVMMYWQGKKYKKWGKKQNALDFYLKYDDQLVVRIVLISFTECFSSLSLLSHLSWFLLFLYPLH